MPCLPINHENLASASSIFDPTRPIYMLNLWKLRPTASYLPEHSALAGSPCSGKEAMDRYRASLNPLLPLNAEVFFMSNPITNVVALEGERWDVVAIIKYEDLEGFKKMVQCDEYKNQAEPHRLAALDDFRLFMLDKLD
ncbi:hypothetical protein BKA66DRAFT_436027 [Pyrenochaeta sp. MPI-SDFR-AT-0127]|nr:hypothetical protein BKA66DRAFT_436027 [Pyrenochaeta sp. MPI-SDFR-AT-0127]